MDEKKPVPFGCTRKKFLQSAAFLGGSAILSPMFDRASGLIGEASAAELPTYELNNAANYITSVCLQCNTGCGIKAKIVDGVIMKIDGNPYSPWTMFPHTNYETPLQDTQKVDGAICAKGQAGLQTAYDPYRITKVLKRTGKRGDNKWATIDFDKAITEIVEGGLLFKDVPGEENRKVEGLRSLYALKDANVAKFMAADAALVGKKKMTVKKFKKKWSDQLHTLIDPEAPDLGPKNNQFAFVWGRLKGGRGDMIKRFAGDSFGSVNAIGHTTVCQGSLYFTGKAMSEQWAYDEKDNKVKWSGGDKFFWEADDANAEFVIYAGVSPTEGNYLSYRSPRIMDGLSSGRLKFAVVDPRFSTLAAKAWKWVPSKPGSEGALAIGLIRWIIENKRYDAAFLSNANKAAALADKESTWSNAPWLVKIDEKGKPGEFLRASEIGIEPQKLTGKGGDYKYDSMVVMAGSKAVACDPNDEKNAVEGELFYEGVVNGHKVKTSFLLLKESALSKTTEQWAEICGIPAGDIEELAREFTSHGKRAVADIHRGVSQHTNGYYNSHAWFTLNLLVGNYDHKGGLIKAGSYDVIGDKAKGPFNLKAAHSGKQSPFGTPIIRNAKYEDSSLFTGYPAKRPWYPLASDIYQEIVPSAGDAYPYPLKAMLLYMGSPVYALPAGNKNIEVLKDPAKLPLFITSDIVIGETSMYADYIFPDLTYLERWEMQGSHPTIVQKSQPVRQPVIAPLVETVMVEGQEMPVSIEAMIIAISLKLGLSGFGKYGLDFADFYHQDDYYLRMVANLAFGEKSDGSASVPDASPEEMELFRQARRHLPKSVYEEARWKKIVGHALWPKVVYVLNRGGRFANASKDYDGHLVSNKYGKLASMYCEKTGTTKDSMTGKKLHGIATYVPAGLDCLGRPVDDGAAYPLTLLTYRRAQHTKSRTASNYWLLDVQPENAIQINPADAASAGVKDGDSVKVLSASNPEGTWQITDKWTKPMIGRVQVDPGMRPGVVTFSLGMGHWMYGVSDVVVDGRTIKGEERRGRGIHANAAMRVDPHIKNTCLTDSVGASAVFYDTRIRLEKAG